MIYIYISLLFSFLSAQVLTNNSFNTSRSISMAGATVSNPGNVEAVFYNPANLSNLKGSSFLVGSTMFYEQENLEYQFAALSFKLDNKNAMTFTIQKLGVNADQYSHDLSSETAISMSQGFHLLNDRNSSLSIGYNANYFILSQGNSAGTAGDGSNGILGKTMYAFGLDIGVIASLREKVFLGAFIKNINSPRIGRGSNAQFLPRRLNIGCSYHPTKSLKTNFVYERLLYSDTNQFRFGVEYEFHKYFVLRTGVQMKPNRFGFGFLSPINDNMSVAYGLLTHPILPLTHNVEFGMYF
tara:strand:+ start:1141 stop:2031 length:891 start_codon:yes stop_codon:yes gene_type:complete